MRVVVLNWNLNYHPKRKHSFDNIRVHGSSSCHTPYTHRAIDVHFRSRQFLRIFKISKISKKTSQVVIMMKERDESRDELEFELSPKKKTLLTIFESMDQVLAIHKSQSNRCSYVKNAFFRLFRDFSF